ncbi:hypothetical protein [Bernardetia sp. MNP-M8]|uniref:hypothetical protein n=1 Tax=Bernardetia sp. MNP-M8 TaxID=3127470 RepID=UPI0030CB9BDD
MDTQTQTSNPTTTTQSTPDVSVPVEKFATTLTELWLSATGKKNYVRTIVRNEKEEIIEDFKANLPKTIARKFLDQPAFASLDTSIKSGYTVVRMP